MSARGGVYESRFGMAVMLAVATMFGGSAVVAGARPLPIQGAKPVSLGLAEKRIAFEVVSIRVRHRSRPADSRETPGSAAPAQAAAAIRAAAVSSRLLRDGLSRRTSPCTG